VPPTVTARGASRLALRLAGVITVAVAAAASTGCSDDPASGRSPLAQRGRQVYVANCTACHNQDPAMPGALGPPLRGTAREVLEAKVLHGRYPAGHTPKRPTSIMPPQPSLAPEIDALADFLRG
jgi:mono/diheme cytochrome c family protein